MARDLDDISIGLGDAAGNSADAYLGDELDGDLGSWIDFMQIVDELHQVLDGVDVVMGWRRNEGHAGLAVSEVGDVLADLGSWELASFSWLGALCNLDLDLLGRLKVLGSHTKSSRCDLFDS